MKSGSSLVTLLVVLAMALGGRAFAPTMTMGGSGSDRLAGPEVAMSMPQMPMDCEMCSPDERAIPICGTACVGPQVVLPMVALAALPLPGVAYDAVIERRFSGLTPPPDPHPPRPAIFA